MTWTHCIVHPWKGPDREIRGISCWNPHDNNYTCTHTHTLIPSVWWCQALSTSCHSGGQVSTWGGRECTIMLLYGSPDISIQLVSNVLMYRCGNQSMKTSFLSQLGQECSTHHIPTADPSITPTDTVVGSGQVHPHCKPQLRVWLKVHVCQCRRSTSLRYVHCIYTDTTGHCSTIAYYWPNNW